MSKRLARSLKKNPVAVLAVAAISAGIYLLSQGGKIDLRGPHPDNGLSASAQYSAIAVERAVDGDTLKLANGERVRLIGIDTPEMHESEKLYRDSRKSGQDAQIIQAMGRRAYKFTKELVEGKTVRLEFDVEKRDKYGRLLGYAYLPDNTFVNAEIIRQGYASVMTYPPNVKHADEFLRLYRQARDSKLGLWKE
jgi:micrococcal nuclease